MKKLSLKLDELAVESFPTSPDPDGEAGTVLAAMAATLRTAQCGSCQGASCFTSCRAEDVLVWDQQCTCPPPA
ncbi:MAG TPA: hypothetical protein VF746_09870 [Longimicrobium sp.]|jgi:hypothetical protein